MGNKDKIELNTDERLDLLGDDYYIIQNQNYFLFGIDAVLLADFASKYIKPKSRVIEVGTGSGIIPLLIAKRTRFKSYSAYEIQKDLADLAIRNIQLNNLEENIKIFHNDIREISNIKRDQADIIVTNPPYYQNKEDNNFGRRTISPNESIRIARNEVTLNLNDLFNFSRKALRQGGKLIMIYRPYRLADVIAIGRKYHLEVKRLRFIYANIEKDSVLVLIELTKDGKPSLIVEKPLIIYENNEYTDEINIIYQGISRKKKYD